MWEKKKKIMKQFIWLANDVLNKREGEVFFFLNEGMHAALNV